jgi:endonuclease YncB( thermonuclease family)
MKLEDRIIVMKTKMTIEEFQTFANSGIDTPYFSLAGMTTNARLVDVYDGDTITCVFPLFGTMYKFSVRLNGIDTCEMKANDSKVKENALLGRQAVLDIVCENHGLSLDCKRKEVQVYLKDNIVIVWLSCLGFDKYGRLIAEVYKDESDLDCSLSTMLLVKNVAYSYNGGKKLTEDEQKTKLN